MNKFLSAIIAIAAIPTILASTADAAEISTRKAGKLNIIAVSGEIVSGDDDKFNKVATKLPAGAVVTFDSIGGNLVAGLNIGIAIKNKKFTTFALGTCASVCALAWLAGTTKYVTKDSSIGFHAAATTTDDKPQVSSGGNALIGAYLSRLGFTYEAIYQMTDSAPEDMMWLSYEAAKKLNIKLTVIKLAQ